MDTERIAGLLGQTAEGATVKAAEQSLATISSLPSFFPVLLDLSCSPAHDAQVRWMATIYLKNGVERHWRKTAPNPIREKEKEYIKERLLNLFCEPSSQIASQYGVIISKIARQDAPHYWPELLPTLLQRIQSTDLLPKERAIRTLLLVVKALCSKALPANRRILHKMTPELFSYLTAEWNQQTARFLDHVGHLEGSHQQPQLILQLNGSLELSLLSLKCLRQLYTFGVENYSASNEILHFQALCVFRLQSFLEIYQQLGDGNFLSNLVKKEILTIGKVYLNCQEFNPSQFLLDNACIDVVSFYCNQILLAHSTKLIQFERFIIQGLQIMRGMIKCKGLEITTHEKEKGEQVGKIKRDQFWTEQRIIEVAQTIISSYLPLTQAELEAWKEDPEELIAVEEEENINFHIRPCVEMVFGVLISEFKEIVAPFTMKVVERFTAPAQDMPSILLKEASYCAFGLGSHQLFDFVDFDSFLLNHLLNEAQIHIPGYELIRKRIAAMIGNWVTVKITRPMRPKVYSLLLLFLDPREDLLVRLTSVKALKECIDDFDFEEEEFGPFLATAIQQLTQLLQQVEEFNTRLTILNTISAIVSRMGPKVKPYSQVLVELLEPLWHYSEGQSVLKISIVALAAKLTEALQADCHVLFPFSLPVIRLSLAEGVLLVEDSLDLWSTTLQHAPCINNDLLALFPVLVPIFSHESEDLRVAMLILSSYVLLGQAHFLNHYAPVIEEIFETSIQDGSLSSSAATVICATMETILRSFPSEGHRLLLKVLPKMAVVILKDQEHSVVITSYLSVFARLALNDLPFFLGFLQAGGQDLRLPFLEKWIDKVDATSQPQHKKLTGFGLCALIRSQDPVILQQLPAIINVCINIFFQLEEPDDGDDDFQSLNPYDEFYSITSDNEEANRRIELMRKDPVENTQLKNFLQESLQICEAMNGKEAFMHFMATVDKEVYSQLQHIFSSK